MCGHTLTLILTNTHSHTHTHVHTHILTQSHTHTLNTLTLTHSYTHTYTLTYSHTLTNSHTHSHTHTQTHSHTLSHTHTHSFTHQTYHAGPGLRLSHSPPHPPQLLSSPPGPSLEREQNWAARSTAWGFSLSPLGVSRSLPAPGGPPSLVSPLKDTISPVPAGAQPSSQTPGQSPRLGRLPAWGAHVDAGLP